MKTLSHPMAACLLSLLLVGLMATGLPGLRVDNSFEIWFPEDDSAMVSYRNFLSEFGNDEVVVLGIQLPDATALAPARTAKLEGLADNLAQQAGVSRVLSLPPLEELAADPFSEPDKITDFFVSRDRTAYKLLVWMAPLPDLESRRQQILEGIDRSAAAAFPDSREIWLAGTGVVLDALNRDSIPGGSFPAFVLRAYPAAVGCHHPQLALDHSGGRGSGTGQLWLVWPHGMAGQAGDHDNDCAASPDSGGDGLYYIALRPYAGLVREHCTSGGVQRPDQRLRIF